MKLKKYLKYNNIQLIDPENEFHASCIQFYADRGYLSPKQLGALSAYRYSVADIERLTSKGKSKPTTASVEEAPSPARKTTALPSKVVAKPAKKLSKKQQKELDSLPF